MQQLTLTDFLEQCLGGWAIERTYHYLPEHRVERSHTDYEIRPLSAAGRQKVLEDNQQSAADNDDPHLAQADGFYLSFKTLSETGERTAMSLNILFIPTQVLGAVSSGLYLRDRAYEENRPLVSQFRYDAERAEMLMTTPYSRVVSVDSITFLNPNVRVRRIVNYRRPEIGQPTEPLLIGFGLEERVS